MADFFDQKPQKTAISGQNFLSALVKGQII
jgi:hypothetical protein